MEITRKEFEKYEATRMSGITNMFDINNVKMLSGLSREKIIFIMKQYHNLMEKYPEVRKN